VTQKYEIIFFSKSKPQRGVIERVCDADVGWIKPRGHPETTDWIPYREDIWVQLQESKSPIVESVRIVSREHRWLKREWNRILQEWAERKE
jgi:hypothetical protein